MIRRIVLITLIAALAAIGFVGPGSRTGVNVRASEDVALSAAGDVAAASAPGPWFANPKLSERDGGAGWGWYGAWTTNSRERPRHYNAYFRELDSGMTGKLNRRGTQGAVGGFFGDWLVYSQWAPGRPGNLFMVGQDGWPFVRFPEKVNTSANEYLPTLWADWLLFTRYNAANDTHRVVLFNRKTKGIRTLASASGRAAVFAGQVRGDYATWYVQGPEQSNVFRYQISTRTTVRIPKPNGFARQHNSAVAADGTVYYQRRAGKACGSSPELVMYPLGGPPTVLWAYPPGKDGRRLVLDPPGAWFGGLNITVVTCALPSARSTDVYWMEPPSNPRP